MRKAIKLLRLIQLSFRLGIHWARFYAIYGLSPRQGDTKDSNGTLHLSSLNIRVNPKTPGGELLLRARHHAEALQQQCQMEFHMQEGELIAMIEGVRMELHRESDFVTLREVFLEDIYRFNLSGEFTFVDIGANLGFTSLYFANRYPGRVIAYELVPSTIAAFKTNIFLNPHLSERISLHEFGLADSDRELDISTNPENSPGNSMEGQPGTIVEHVVVRDASQAILEIIASANNKGLVVKLDVEGAEYAIMRRWQESNCLKDFVVLFIEWHQREGESVNELRSILSKAGFEWFERHHPDAPAGFITAFRH